MNETGVRVERGAADWQVFQQDADGCATLRLFGRWSTGEAHRQAGVWARVVREDTHEAVTRALDWRAAQTSAQGAWTVELAGVPRGGLYRIETCLRLDGQPIEWALRGDMVHHVGVGDVWVIAGQSNSAGYGKSPACDGPELGIHMFHACGAWRLAAHPLGDSTGSRYTANRERANASHSPYLQFARVLRRELGHPIGLVPAALGGSAISQWLCSLDGALFRNMLAYVRDSGGGCRGVVWYQGESDTGPDARALYAERFAELVADMRRELGRADLPVITAQLNRHIGESRNSPVHAGWDAIREAQRQAARRIPGVYVVSTIDLGLSDGIHNNSGANLTIGERMAAMALGGVHGRDVKCLHPDLALVRRVGARLELTFANVDRRLHYECRTEGDLPFRVDDAGGVVPVVGWELREPDGFVLELARAPGADAVVTGAPGAAPPVNVPFDIAGYRPMLAFRAPVPDA